MLVEQQPHELGYGERRMGVVELNGEPFMEVVGPTAAKLVEPQQILKRAGHEKILLLKPQFLALGRFVIGVEHFGECL